MSRAPLFFSFDGIDGVGKSTQVRLFCEWLRESGHEVVTCRDPGSTQAGEALRRIVLQESPSSMDRRCEMLIYMAARAQLVEEIIRPALRQGSVVVSDRYLLANIVYQGHAGGLDVDQIRRVGEIATGGLIPTQTILLDMAAEEAARRINRATDRMEQQGTDYFRRVRQGFLDEAARCPGEIVVVDASQPVAKVQADIRDVTKPTLDSWT